MNEWGGVILIGDAECAADVPLLREHEILDAETINSLCVCLRTRRALVDHAGPLGDMTRRPARNSL